MKTTLPIIAWMIILLPLGIAADVLLEGVSVVGQATVELPANQVRLKTSVHESAKEAMTAQSMLEKRTRKVLKFLEDLGVPRDAVTLSASRLIPEFKKRGSGERKLRRYDAFQDITVTIKDLDLYDRLVLGAVEAGVDFIWDVVFERSDILDLRRQARIEAIKAARDKAVYLAKAIDQDIGPAVWISEEERTQYGIRSTDNTYIFDGIDTSSNKAPSTAAGQTIKVKAKIAARFTLK